MTDPAKNILRTYLRRLTNLTGNNRSLFLLRLHAEQLLDVNTLGFLNGGRAFGVINALISGKEKKICPVLDSRVEASNEMSKRIKKMQRIDHFIFEERGSNDLHVGWPFVEGKFSDGTLVRCPLLFFPVQILQDNNDWVLQPREDAGITLNKSFLLAYAFYNKVKLNEELLETNFEDFDSDSTVFRTEVYQLLRDKIEINFNPDNFRDELSPFREYKKDEFTESHNNGELKLFPEAVLGIFPQAGSQLVPDYLTLLEQPDIADLEDFFVSKSAPVEGLSMRDGVVREEKVYTPFVLDAYQEEAIRAVKNGNSIVVQGPPGTGKSQLIANLLSDAIASGKRALLVCQKRAALDVVYERLKQIDLGDFLGLVHDFRNDRKEIFDTIARQIEKIDDYKARNRTVDTIQMERRFVQVCRSIDQLTEELESFRKNLFDDSECGLSVKELYLTSDPHGASINIRQEYQFFLFDNLAPFLKVVHRYAAFAAAFEKQTYAWRERRSFSAFAVPDLREIQRVVSDVPAFQRDITARIEQIIPVTLDLTQSERFQARESEVLGMTALLRHSITYSFFKAMIDQPDDETSLLWFSNIERVVINCFRGEGPEVSLAATDLGRFQEVLLERTSARRSLISRLRWNLFSKHKPWLQRVMEANALTDTKEGLKSLENRLDNRLNLEHHLTAIKQRPWLTQLPGGYDKKLFQTWFDRHKLAIRAKLVFNSLIEVKDAINVAQYDGPAFAALLDALLHAVADIPGRKKDWLNYLTPYQLRILMEDPAREKEFLHTLKNDFDNLAEYDKLKESLQPHERDVLMKLFDTVSEWHGPRLEALFQNSIRLAWIDHIEAKNPMLRTVSSDRMDHQQNELQQFVEEKQKLAKDIMLLRAREKVYDALEYNRLNNRVTYRDLNHQVTKKKNRWPLRKLITEFDSELFNLVPCWLASPESVSAIFPMRELFDIVIFDEASQCFAERGIPAMYRGKQVVVAGDDMQLKPAELYQVRWEEESEHPNLEVDSLLDLTGRYLATVHLQGHYRSKSLELIDFSNRHFYGGRLQLLPDRHAMNRKQPAIEYNRVNGVWNDHTNEVEAAAVVERVLSIVRINPEKEIGIVTFNAPQQMLILDLLEDAFASASLPIPASLMVKNIENVQGDEKDIIIFSVGYAPDKKGKMVMQFGSLNMPGGENRLNVAVTRAREKIILICSIGPEDLRTDDVKNEGPKLLKQYLVYAREVDEGKFKTKTTYKSVQSGNWYLSGKVNEIACARFPGLRVETDSLPFADVAFDREGEYGGVILTDDVRYLSGINIKEPHAYTPALLTRKNWDYLMIFSRNFWQHRERVENELAQFINARTQSE